ncbi:zinc metalloprotease HtpX [Oxynema aestuarii]|uniref:M48 family metalloprotease n=1 Tax=Oxynema aestuarii AP17 TaxID=2064643 RepID=A0A6H1TY87_9CYAN|nr:zinc metalloprotease HtpX [Oxynema aestuarii]QIZ70880.1 M48 family metalloprotease [Oxynema aestuarii AP17]
MNNSDLASGLAALKQKDYDGAIACLNKVCETELDAVTIARAQMGLTIAYTELGQFDRAVVYCDRLQQSGPSKFKQWARRHRDRHLSRISPPSLPQKNSKVNSKSIDPTGFVPFNESATPTALPSDPTGFIPLEDPPPPQAPPKRSRRDSLRQPSPKEKAVSRHGKERRPPPFPPVKPKSLPQPPRSRSDASGVSPLTGKPQPPTQSATGARSPAPSLPQPPSKRQPTPQPTPEVTPAIADLPWRHGPRAKNWKRFQQRGKARLLAIQVVSAIAGFWFLDAALHWLLQTTNYLLYKLPLLWPIQGLYRDRSLELFAFLLLLAIASPWILDLILGQFYSLKPLGLSKLGQYSTEARRLVPRFCYQRNWPTVKLGVLPTPTPMAFTYGGLPRFSRIVVTQGLLDQLADDEIAAIYAGELGHLASGTVPLMSLFAVLTQLPYLLYWQLAREGDRWTGRRSTRATVMRRTAGWLASFNYGLFWLLRWLGLPLARARIVHGDRFAVSLTGNPNGLSRALLKLCVGIARDVEQQQQTSYLLEGLESLNPVGCQQAIALGSTAGQMAWEPLLAWDRYNPDRGWLNLSNSHPCLGDRLYGLSRSAQFWKLEPELVWPEPDAGTQVKPKIVWSRRLLQGAPFFGAPWGLSLGLLLWAIGAVSNSLGVRELDWLWGDRAVLFGCTAIGIGLGILLRINAFFPDITPSNRQDDPNWAESISNPDALPLDAQPVRLQGTLLGRRGVANWLAQDTILRSPSGLVKIHGCSILGPSGFLGDSGSRPSNFVGSSAIAIGWLRRGATPWLDLDRLELSRRQVINNHHPIWSTVLAFLCIAWGVYSLFQGG